MKLEKGTKLGRYETRSQIGVGGMGEVTNPGVIMGTAGYMSPEQVRGLLVDHRSDIFSFGVILYEMITGRRAFQEESLAETMSAIVKEEPPEMTESNHHSLDP